MKIIEIIKRRSSTRNYKKKSISKEKINKIFDAGLWGPSVHHFQPWKFIFVTNQAILKEINAAVEENARIIKVPDGITMPSMKTLNNAPSWLFVYNTKAFSKAASKSNPNLCKSFELAERSAIAAAIQNMILVMEELGIGSCWIGLPLFIPARINKILNQKDELVAVLTVGIPAQKGIRTPRIDSSGIIEIIN